MDAMAHGRAGPVQAWADAVLQPPGVLTNSTGRHHRNHGPLTAGTVMLMWFGELIPSTASATASRGHLRGIVGRIPNNHLQTADGRWALAKPGPLLLFAALAIVVTAFIIEVPARRSERPDPVGATRWWPQVTRAEVRTAVARQPVGRHPRSSSRSRSCSSRWISQLPGDGCVPVAISRGRCAPTGCRRPNISDRTSLQLRLTSS